MSTDSALGDYLRSLREAAGIDASVLARRLSLSTAQLVQLENGQDSLFYNRGIRQQAARKVILHLGGDPARLVGDEVPRALPQAAPPAPPLLVQADLPAASLEAAPEVVARTEAPRAPAKASSRVLVGGVSLSLLLFGGAFVAGRFTPPSGPPALAANAPFPVPQVDAAATPGPVADPGPPAADALALQAPSTDAPVCIDASGPVPAVQPPQASKPGDMVYVVSSVSQVLCLTDAQGRQQQQRLEAGQALSFYGQPPWQVHSAQLRQTQLYFQGWKVRLPDDAQDRVQLVELR